MKRGDYKEDPVAYRIAYSRLAQALHRELPKQASKKPSKLCPKRSGLQDEPSSQVTETIEELLKSRPATQAKSSSRSLEKAKLDIAAEALNLVNLTRGHLAELGWEWVEWTPRTWHRWLRCRGDALRLAEFLEQVVEPATVVFYFSARLEATGKVPPVHEDGEEKPLPLLRRRFTPEDYYEIVGVEGEWWLECYLRQLTERATPGQFSPPGFGWKPGPGINYRVHYNLACMYARMGVREEPRPRPKRRVRESPPKLTDGPFKRAEEQLALAVAGARGHDRTAMVEWAGRDPTLAPFRERYEAEFNGALLPDALPGDLI